jgi:hypothetical protein
MQLFKVEVGEVQKIGTLAVLVSKTKPLLKSMSGYFNLAEMTRLNG